VAEGWQLFGEWRSAPTAGGYRRAAKQLHSKIENFAA